jgi:hypothetical protein
MMRTTLSRLSAAALALGLVGAAAPLMGAGPEVKVAGLTIHPPKVFGNVQIRIGDRNWGRDRDRHEKRIEEVIPCDLHFSAYQSRDTVILVATGANRTGGFTTTFAPCDLNDRTPEVRLVNTPGRDACAQALTPFEVSTSFHSRYQLGCIKVVVAGHSYDVHVTQTACM